MARASSEPRFTFVVAISVPFAVAVAMACCSIAQPSIAAVPATGVKLTLCDFVLRKKKQKEMEAEMMGVHDEDKVEGSDEVLEKVVNAEKVEADRKEVEAKVNGEVVGLRRRRRMARGLASFTRDEGNILGF